MPFFFLHRSSGNLYMTSVNSTGLNVPKPLSGFIIIRVVMINSLLVESRESGQNVNLNFATALDALTGIFFFLANKTFIE